MAQSVRPDFTIIDGVEGMEGNGPINGTPVDHRIAMAGFDVVAIDSMCARLMGIPLENVGYLNYCASAGLGNMDRDKIDIIGSKDPDKSIITYKLGSNIGNQLEWKEPFNLPAPVSGHHLHLIRQQLLHSLQIRQHHRSSCRGYGRPDYNNS